MFKSALVRLTIWYLAIVMLISVGFSVALFQVSTNEIGQRLNRQATVYRGIIGDFTPFDVPLDISGLDRTRDELLSEGSNHLQVELIYLNLLVLMIGGWGSYLLAKRTLKPIEEAHKSQIKFTADASHELRTPLTAMRTEIEVALRDKKITKEETVELLNSNLEEVVKLKGLTDHLLQVAKGDLKQTDLSNRITTSQFELVAAVEEVIDKLKPLAAKKTISLTTDLTKQTLTSDRELLQELLTILIDNAIKYSPSDKMIVVSSQVEGKQLKLSVKDFGPGIKEKDLPRIFDRFFRVDDSRSKVSEEKGGYGLGLAIAKQLVVDLGGKLTVKSTYGEGSTFTVQLPASSLI